jgi:Zn2+/Cd2+-exporting ATPase
LGARSEHPLARAVTAHAASHGIRPDAIEHLRALPGQGAEGRLADGDEAIIGSRRLFEERGIALDGVLGPARARESRDRLRDGGDAGDLARPRAARAAAACACAHDDDALHDMSVRGLTLVLVGRAGRAIGVIGLRDELRSHGREAVDLLRAEGIEHVALLTGDHAHSARAAGDAGQVDAVEAALLPADKVRAIERLRERHGSVAMVGDGINDAPALAAADVGVAMGTAGTHAAIETADVALMADDLRALSYVMRLGRATLRTVQVNIAIALGLKLAFMTLAIAGVATLWMAVVADMGASLLVVANGLRLLRAR